MHIGDNEVRMSRRSLVYQSRAGIIKGVLWLTSSLLNIKFKSRYVNYNASELEKQGTERKQGEGAMLQTRAAAFWASGCLWEIESPSLKRRSALNTPLTTSKERLPRFFL